MVLLLYSNKSNLSDSENGLQGRMFTAGSKIDCGERYEKTMQKVAGCINPSKKYELLFVVAHFTDGFSSQLLFLMTCFFFINTASRLSLRVLPNGKEQLLMHLI